MPTISEILPNVPTSKRTLDGKLKTPPKDPVKQIEDDMSVEEVCEFLTDNCTTYDPDVKELLTDHIEREKIDGYCYNHLSEDDWKSIVPQVAFRCTLLRFQKKTPNISLKEFSGKSLTNLVQVCSIFLIFLTLGGCMVEHWR